MKYKTGLFQGDSLSTLLLCLAITPFSWALDRRREIHCRSFGRVVTHTLLIDDLKVYANSKSAPRQLKDRRTSVTSNWNVTKHKEVSNGNTGQGNTTAHGRGHNEWRCIPNGNGHQPKYIYIYRYVFASHSGTLQQEQVARYLMRIKKI